MSLFGTLKRAIGFGADASPARARGRGRLQAKYDGAANTVDMARHWAAADLLSPDAAANPQVRARLRSRARYEVHESNSFASGIVRTMANYVIGTGPRLKMMTGRRESDWQIQRSWERWCRATRFAEKLRTMRIAKACDGEAIALMATNPRLNHEVKLDLKLVEADLMTTPNLDTQAKNRVDGVDFDEFDNPIRYWFLKEHPGGSGFANLTGESYSVDAKYVIHWFRRDRPGQHRGVTEFAPALPLFGLVRRYTLAVLAAAETAAMNANVMYTDGPNVEPDDSVEPMEAIELEMRAMLTLPAGWKAQQMKAEQPTTTFEMFRNALWNETARCMLMPFNIAAGNSSGYNFASGRLDHQAFDLAIDTERYDGEVEVLDRVFAMWLQEYLSVTSGIAASDIDVTLYPHRCYWPPREHVDPQKEASAKDTQWQTGHLSDEDILFEAGVDPEEHYEALARQQERRKALGLPLPGAAGAAAGSGQPAGGSDGEEDGDEEEAANERETAAA